MEDGTGLVVEQHPAQRLGVIVVAWVQAQCPGQEVGRLVGIGFRVVVAQTRPAPVGRADLEADQNLVAMAFVAVRAAEALVIGMEAGPLGQWPAEVERPLAGKEAPILVVLEQVPGDLGAEMPQFVELPEHHLASADRRHPQKLRVKMVVGMVRLPAELEGLEIPRFAGALAALEP
jgi:hypothetical protein